MPGLTDKVFLASIGIAAVGFYFLPRPYNWVALIVPVLAFMFRVVMPWAKSKMIVSEVDVDLVFLILHMYGVSTGKPPRKKIFTPECVAGDYGYFDQLLRRIVTLAIDWGYGFVTACRVVAETCRHKVFKDFLYRFSEILNVGEDPERFLSIEKDAILAEYQAHYTRAMDAMRILLGVYTTSVSSAIFLAATTLIFAMMFAGDIGFIVSAFGAIMLSLAMLVYIIYKVIPRDRLTHTLPVYPKIKNFYRVTAFLAVATAASAAVLVYFMFRNPANILIACSLPLIVPGIVAKKMERDVKEMDCFFPIFIRSYGLTFATMPHHAQALSSVLRSAFGKLTLPLKRLYARLVNGVMPRVAWYYFVGETWSETIRHGVNVFLDTVEAGGDAAKIGPTISDTITKILNIRRLRDQISKTFEVTVYVVHALMVAIAMFILGLLESFQTFMMRLGATGGPIPLPFTPIPVEPVRLITTIFILVVAALNAMAIKIAQGGMYETVWIPLSLLLAISGATMILATLGTTAIMALAFRGAPMV